MSKQSTLKGNRLYCPVQTYKDELFFSLVDYHNSLFICDDFDEIIEFHDSFNEGSSLGIYIGTPKVVTNIYANNVGAEIYAVISTFDSGEISVL